MPLGCAGFGWGGLEMENELGQKFCQAPIECSNGRRPGLGSGLRGLGNRDFMSSLLEIPILSSIDGKSGFSGFIHLFKSS